MEEAVVVMAEAVGLDLVVVAAVVLLEVGMVTTRDDMAQIVEVLEVGMVDEAVIDLVAQTADDDLAIRLVTLMHQKETTVM